MSNGTKVVKRDGSIQPLDLEKMHIMVEEACDGLAGVSARQVEIQSGLQFFDGIKTAEIQEILIKSASDLIDLEKLLNIDDANLYNFYNGFKTDVVIEKNNINNLFKNFNYK